MFFQSRKHFPHLLITNFFHRSLTWDMDRLSLTCHSFEQITKINSTLNINLYLQLWLTRTINHELVLSRRSVCSSSLTSDTDLDRSNPSTSISTISNLFLLRSGEMTLRKIKVPTRAMKIVPYLNAHLTLALFSGLKGLYLFLSLNMTIEGYDYGKSLLFLTSCRGARSWWIFDLFWILLSNIPCDRSVNVDTRWNTKHQTNYEMGKCKSGSGFSRT